MILYTCGQIINCFVHQSEYKHQRLYFHKKKKKLLKCSHNKKCFYATHAKVLFCLISMLFCLLVVNIYLLSLKTDVSSSIKVVKSFNSCIALCNYIITICITITSILTTQVLLKSRDIEINQEPKK